MALIATLITFNLTGTLMPLLLKKIKPDPALTTGSLFATVIDVVVKFTIYFSTATLLLNYLSRKDLILDQPITCGSHIPV